ncbi:ABC transporter [Nanoarchaeota archaeon]|nr:MAG: ABC transporter [Nanoarchaeota archaeon]
MAIISVKNLKKNYKRVKRKPTLFGAFKSMFMREHEIIRALKGISFTVDEGEILGMIGPNGAGKSTTVKILTGILVPTSGKVNVAGYNPWRDRVEYVKNIGVVFGQKSHMWWMLPPESSFKMYKELYNIDDKDYKRRLDYLVDMLDVRKVIQTPVRNLSLGERIKCNIVAAFLHNPKIVFLDEPTIGLDVESKHRVRKFLKEINKEYNTTIILTTHDMIDIEQTCDRVVVIDKGILRYDGELEYLKKKYAWDAIIKARVRKPVKSLRMNGVSYTKKDDYNLVFRIDTRKASIGNLVNRIAKYGIIDLTVEEPSIEEVVRRMYNE